MIMITEDEDISLVDGAHCCHCNTCGEVSMWNHYRKQYQSMMMDDEPHYLHLCNLHLLIYRNDIREIHGT